MYTSTKTPLGRTFLRSAFIGVTLASVCFAPMPMAQAVVPSPDGGYPGQNTAEGEDALFGLTTGLGNTANGYQALYGNTGGDGNTASGDSALFTNITGNDNTAAGGTALYSNTTGSYNTANGTSALYRNTTGSFNTATGMVALQLNTTGAGNTATGFGALFANTDGSVNTATGYGALQGNSTGNFNTATGHNALLSNTTGSRNIALGNAAGYNLTTGDNNIDIGNAGVAGESNTIRIGTIGTQSKIFVAGIMGKSVPMSVPVFVNGSGQLGTVQSSARFKDGIKPMDQSSEGILALKPVTFRYKKELDPEGIPQFGLVAEDVEKVNPDLVVRDADGKVYTVRYDAVNAMLLNEFLKEHRKVQEQEAAISQLKSSSAKQEATIARLQEGMNTVVALFKEQDAKIQKVSAELELSNPAPQTVVNNH